MDRGLSVLDEYGVPVELGRKLEPFLAADGDVDATLAKLREFDASNAGLDEFEESLVRDAQSFL